MWLSDTSVKRPVFATVVALVLVAFGALSFQQLPLREYPNINAPVVSVSTNYVGASAEVIETRITQLIEDQVSGIEGVKVIRSSSQNERSNVSIEFELARNIDEAANDVRDRVGRIVTMLPEDAEAPRVAKQDADAQPAMFMSLSSTTMGPMELTDYAERYIIDRFAVISGVADARVNGSGRPSMRIWLDRSALAARNLTVVDLESALRRENIELPAGRIDSRDREFQVRIARGYSTAQDFRELVVSRGSDGHLIRLGELAEVEVGPRDLRSVFRANRQNTVGIAIVRQSTANTLEVLETVKAEMERVNANLPEGMYLVASTDDSAFIREAINSVFTTILITIGLVSAVIFVFLGSLRAMIIPAVTIPVCLISSFIALAAFGFSVNLITLLALVLCIGLVVDDAIVVLENVHRRVEGGEPPLLASYNGARQVAFAVIATTAVLVAVFLPIVFLQDNVGRIFEELAVTIGAAVIFSSVLALSLTPMMCSKLLKPPQEEGRLIGLVDRGFEHVASAYERLLGRLLRLGWVLPVVWAAVVAGGITLFMAVPGEYVPQEDQGAFMARAQAPEGTGYEYMVEQMMQLEEPVMPWIESGDVMRALVRMPAFGGTSPSSGIMFITMAPWRERVTTTEHVMNQLLAEWNKVPGVRVFAFMRQGLSRTGGGGPPVQFVVGGNTYEELAQWRDILIEHAENYPGLMRVDSDLRETEPQIIVQIDRNRAADLGVSVQAVGRTLSAMMSERRITTYVDGGEEYDVILQARGDQRATPQDLTNVFVRSETTGTLVPLSNLIAVDTLAGPGSLNRYNRMRAVTITAMLAPGHALGDALGFLERTARSELPSTAQIDYRGQSLEYMESSRSMIFAFGLALVIVFLVLAAQFESFRQPVVILSTVPLALAGALLGLYLAGKTFNIYSQIGLIMLVGIAAKNGILIVEFINQRLEAGVQFMEAIVQAARIRFRPVIMTALATMMGSLPLMLASGAGSESRTTLGIVIFSGVLIATFLTLFIVPAFFQLIASRRGARNTVERELAAMQEGNGRQPAH
jgi:multidrug efflux pump